MGATNRTRKRRRPATVLDATISASFCRTWTLINPGDDYRVFADVVVWVFSKHTAAVEVHERSFFPANSPQRHWACRIKSREGTTLAARALNGVSRPRELADWLRAHLSDAEDVEVKTEPRVLYDQRYTIDAEDALTCLRRAGSRSCCSPSRPVAVDPSWRTSAVIGVARGIYAELAFDRLPILADALQDAGCENAVILAHCRAGKPHSCGCWVVDSLLDQD